MTFPGLQSRGFGAKLYHYRGEPLETAAVVGEAIARTTTETGLEGHAWLDENTYAKGRTVSAAQLPDDAGRKPSSSLFGAVTVPLSRATSRTGAPSDPSRVAIGGSCCGSSRLRRGRHRSALDRAGSATWRQ